MEEMIPLGESPAEETKTAEELGRALIPQRRRFVQEYIIDLNGTEAARRAGYSAKNAASLASRMLRDPDVRAYRDALLQEAFESIGVTRYTIAAEVWKIYNRCAEKVPVMEWDKDRHAWVATGTWQFDAKGALKALGMMATLLRVGKENEQDVEPGGYEDSLYGDGREAGGRNW